MSTFTCVCGNVTCDDAEPDGTSLVAYPVETLSSNESRIAQRVAAYVALDSNEARLEQQRKFYAVEEMPEQQSRDFVEDLVTYEMNSGSVAIYRCPACHRIAVKEDEASGWKFFRPEPRTHK
jgi:anion-transporting  ArsA/GET3 family ATPase